MTAPGTMSVPTGDILEHLRVLVAADSSDPVTTMSPTHGAVTHCVRTLSAAGFEVSIDDLGDGCVNVLATRGESDAHKGVLFNCHLDTVKVNPNWTRDPFALTVEGEGPDAKAYGLGATDIKGAAACLLAVAEATDQPMAILFTTDEEGGKGTCVNTFVRTHAGAWDRVVVAEPTGAKIVRQHRGFASFEVTFRGTAGHTSGANASAGSAIHKAVRWMNAALDLAEPGGLLDGSRFNIGIVHGGTASNVVASEATVRFGFRPEPGGDAAARTDERVRALKALLPEHSLIDGSVEWTDRFLAPPLTADARTAGVAEEWGVECGPDVDFLDRGGAVRRRARRRARIFPAVVLGPGDIAQAHAADEFVSVAQLESCARAYASIVHAGAAVATGVADGGGGVHAP
jgi:acetylornithine deacetylase